MEQSGGPAAADAPTCAVTLAVGGGAGPSKTFALRIGEVLRVGRGPVNDFVLALGGISTCHAELFLRPREASGGEDLCVRDTSKNGTGVQSVGGGVPTQWKALPRGGLTRLQNGWKLLLPLKGMPKEAAELAHTLTVGITMGNKPAAKDRGLSAEATATPAGNAVKAKDKTPQRKDKPPKEKKEKQARDGDGARKRKHEDQDEALARARRRDVGNERHGLADGHSNPVAAAQGQLPWKGTNDNDPRKHRTHRRRRRVEGDPRDPDPERREKKEKRRRRREDEREG